MHAYRIAILLPVALTLLVGLAASQVPDPAIPVAEPPATAVPSPLPAVQPPVPPTEFPPTQIPGVPDAGFPSSIPGMPPALPNLDVPPPGVVEGPWLPPTEPRAQQSDNPLLKLFDTDGDGVLSGDEVDAAPARLWELDRNLDAQLSADELGLVLAPRWQQRRRAVRGYLPVEPTQVQPEMPAVPELPLGNERPRFEVYPLRGLDPAQTLATLQRLLQDQPDARLTFDGRTRSILALAQPSAHAKIRDTLASLLEGDRAGLPGLPPALEPAAAGAAALPALPRVVPLYNARSREILRVVRQVYRDRIVEPRADQPADNLQIPGVPLPPPMEAPTVPAGKMVVGVGADPNTIVVSAEDELFFEVLDLIERLDASQEPAAGQMEVPPPR